MAKFKKCKFCGNSFATRHSTQLYCCKSCSSQAFADLKAELATGEAITHRLKCNFCGKPFTNKRRKSYCSNECRLMANGRCARPKPKDKKAEKPKVSIAEVCVLARQQGLTYGQYVAKYGS
jgi:hypothetical protein